MVFLGIDFGERKIGLAIAETKIPEPVGVWRNNRKFFGRLAIFCEERMVDKVIIGQPEGDIGEEARVFGERLGRELLLPVEFFPETLTTHDAIAKMLEAGRGRNQRREREDAVSAALLLQEYLETTVRKV